MYDQVVPEHPDSIRVGTMYLSQPLERASSRLGGWKNGWERYRRTVGRRGQDGLEYLAKVGVHYIRGNKLPYWSVTGEGWDRSRMAREPEVFVCLDTELMEPFPELRRAIAWHLCDTEGLPMHYAANTCYHAELFLGISRWEKGPQPHHYAYTHSTAVTSELGDAAELDALLSQPLEVSPPPGIIWEQFGASPEGKAAKRALLRERLEPWLTARLPRLKTEFRGMAQHYGISLEPPEEWVRYNHPLP